MVDVLDRWVGLIGVVLRLPAVLGPPVGEDSLQLDSLSTMEWDHLVIQQVGRGDGALVGLELAAATRL